MSFFVGISGWIQYLWIPDLTSLKYLGWDDHAYRLTGTFLDPTFTGIILVFGLILSKLEYIRENNKIYLFLVLYFLVTIAFTYSRAVYLSFIVSLFTISLLKNKMKHFFLTLSLFSLTVFLLPKNLPSVGVDLERTFSIYARFDNYIQTAAIIIDNPLIGVGYNNICPARVIYFNDVGYESHSCSGSDSGILLILATTGTVGLMVFVYFLWIVINQAKDRDYKYAFYACLTALFIHSLFVNSIFNPWIMGYMGLLLAVVVKRDEVKAER